VIGTARRSIFWRIVLIAIALSAALVAGLWLMTDQTIRSTLDQSARDAVDVDIAGLVDIYASGGQAELERRIADRIAIIPADGGAPHYLLADAQGVRIAGDIDRWPALDASASESGIIRIGEATSAYARATRLGPDLKIVVARETGDSAGLLRGVAINFLLGGGAFVFAIGLFGRLAAIHLQRRIERINQAFRDPSGQIDLPGSMGSGGDEIDELAARSANLLDRERNLKEAYRDTSDQIAHEIRTPLMHLDRRLVRALAANPQIAVAHDLSEARGDIRRVVDTLESLLDINASHARKGDRAGLSRVNLSELVERICDLYADSIEDSGHAFQLSIEPDVVILGEESQLGRLVTNLLDNALKYVPPGGTITLSLQHGPILTVADDGPGIAPEDRERVFDRFFRGHKHGEGLPGNGLGLALARAIAERHGLTLGLLDTEKGASFQLKGGRM